MSTTPPGWYDDGRGAQRWWNGQEWTDSVATATDAADGQEAASPAAGPDPSDGTAAGPVSAAALPADRPRSSSRLWIVWAALAAAVAVMIVLGVILATLIGGVVDSVSGLAGEGPDQQGAVAAVELYDDAWAQGDCSALEGSTTEEFREFQELGDCAVFEQRAAELDASTDDYELTVISIEPLEDGSIEVSTSETYLALVDESGAPLDTPEPVEEPYTYVVVQADGAWLVDDVR